MKNLHHASFGTRITELGVIHRQSVTPVTIRAYWDVLEEMDFDDFERAVRILKKTGQWFPKPAEFFAASRKGWT